MDTEESAWLLDARNEDAESNCTAPTSKLVLSPDEARIERGTVRKVDLRLLLILGALYSISIIDRTNLSAARVAGMEKDLRLTVGARYSVVTLVFFIPYILFEIPSNVLLSKIGARTVISGITIGWGLVMFTMGFVSTWGQLAALRALLGVFESGFFPGCVFLIQTWYTRYETQKRMAAFYLVSTIVAGFSGIPAYALSLLDGAYGLAGWRWIFIVEGAFTVLLAAAAANLIVDFPEKNTFLTADETRLMLSRIAADRDDARPDALTLTTIVRQLTDLRTWAIALCFMSTTVASYALSYFLPILQGGGYSTFLSLCLPAPPYVLGGACTFALAWAADRMHCRGPFIILAAFVCAAGLLIVGYAESIGVRYAGSFLAIAGSQANVPALLTYTANNVRLHSKRAVSSAIIISMGGVGGIIASLVYRQVDFPRYLPGLWVSVGCQGLIVVLVGFLTTHARSQNRAADEGHIVIEGIDGFRYTI